MYPTKEKGKKIIRMLYACTVIIQLRQLLCIDEDNLLPPVAWWQQHGVNCLQLQQIAVQILSQTCSSFAYTIRSTANEEIVQHRNDEMTLSMSTINWDLGNTKYEKVPMTRSPLTDSGLQESLLFDWIVHAKKQTFLEDEVTFKLRFSMKNLILSYRAESEY